MSNASSKRLGKIWYRDLLHRGDSWLYSHRYLGTCQDDVDWRNHYFVSFI